MPWGRDTNPFSIISAVTSGNRLPVPSPDSVPAGPLSCFDKYVELMQQCCVEKPEDRPATEEVVQRLRTMLMELVQQRIDSDQARVRSSDESSS